MVWCIHNDICSWVFRPVERVEQNTSWIHGHLWLYMDCLLWSAVGSENSQCRCCLLSEKYWVLPKGMATDTVSLVPKLTVERLFCKGTPTKKTIWIRNHEPWHRDKSPKNRTIQIQDLEDLTEYRCVDQLLWPGRLKYMDDFMDEIHHTDSYSNISRVQIYIQFMAYICMVYILNCIYM